MRPVHLSVVSAPDDDGTKVPAVELRGVGKTFVSRNGRVDVLSGLNLSLRDGEFVAIVGPSGSGKSTMRIASWCCPPGRPGSSSMN